MQPIDYANLLKERKFDHNTAITADKIYFTINDGINDPAVIGTAGNFIALTGLPKAGKSTFISAIISSFLYKPVFGFNLKGQGDKYKIALFDTEQSPGDFNRTINRIQSFTGYDRPGIFKFFNSFLCREDDSKTILKLINQYLKDTPDLAVLIIDGILDCVDNFNSEEESKRIIRILKKWSKIHDILIITVLHLGKKDMSSIGHLGSSSDRYAQSTLLIEKTKEGTFTFSPKFLRSAKDFETIEIKYSKERNNYIQIKP